MSRRAIAAKAGATGNLFVLSNLVTVSGFFQHAVIYTELFVERCDDHYSCTSRWRSLV